MEPGVSIHNSPGKKERKEKNINFGLRGNKNQTAGEILS